MENIEKHIPVIFIGIVLLLVIFGPYFQKSRKKINLIDYMCNCAASQKVPKVRDEVYNFFVLNFDKIKLSYVYMTKEALIINSVPDLLEKAVTQYLNLK